MRKRESMALMEVGDETVHAVLKRFRQPPASADEPRTRVAVGDVMTAFAHFSALLTESERPSDPLELLEFSASTNAFDPLRVERGLPVTVVFYSSVHPSYYEGEDPIGAPAWRLCYTDGGGLDASAVRERLLDEVIRLAEAMHDKNPFGEVPFEGGKTVLVQEGSRFQAVTAIYGDMGMPRLILAKGGIRYYAVGEVTPPEKQCALARWAASSVLAGVLAHQYIGGPDMRMGEEEMAWIDAAAAEIGAARRVRQHPAVTGLAADAGGFPHQAWELTGRTVAASLKEALRHRATARYRVDASAPIRVLIQGFGDVGGSVARLLTEESPEFQFRIAGVADEFGAIYRSDGLDAGELLRLREARRSIVEYGSTVDRFWITSPSKTDRARPGFQGTDSRELLLQEAEIFIPAAIPNVIDEGVAPRLQVRIVAEGANNAVAPHVEELLHRQGILYLPGQALNWGGVKSSTLEALFRELTKRSIPFAMVEERVRDVLHPLGAAIDLPWALELLRSGLTGTPLSMDETRAFAISMLEDLARSNTRWLMSELAASRFERPPLDLVRSLSRTVRSLKVQLLSLIEQGLGPEFFASDSSLQRLKNLLDDRLKELLSDSGSGGLTSTQVVEQRQMLQQLQNDIPAGLSPVFASLLAALDLARQKVMDPGGYSHESLRADLARLREPKTPLIELEASLYRLQRVHPGLDRAEFVRALADLIRNRELSPVARRNAALALAKMGSADPNHRTVLLEGARDPDLSVSAACHWALGQMAVSRE